MCLEVIVAVEETVEVAVAVAVAVEDFLTVKGLDVALQEFDAIHLVSSSEKFQTIHRNMWHYFYWSDFALFRLALCHHISASQKETRHWHYIILNNGILKSNSSIFPRSEGYITQ